ACPRWRTHMAIALSIPLDTGAGSVGPRHVGPPLPSAAQGVRPPTLGLTRPLTPAVAGTPEDFKGGTDMRKVVVRRGIGVRGAAACAWIRDLEHSLGVAVADRGGVPCIGVKPGLAGCHVDRACGVGAKDHLDLVGDRQLAGITGVAGQIGFGLRLWGSGRYPRDGAGVRVEAGDVRDVAAERRSGRNAADEQRGRHDHDGDLCNQPTPQRSLWRAAARHAWRLRCAANQDCRRLLGGTYGRRLWLLPDEERLRQQRALLGHRRAALVFCGGISLGYRFARYTERLD